MKLRMTMALALATALLGCGEVAVTPAAEDDAGAAAVCAAPLADCDHDGTCETTLGTVEACGACGDVCAASHAAASCAGGACQLACDLGFTDCNGLGSDGCEAQLAVDPRNCGACGHDCGEWGDCLQGTCVQILANAAALMVGADALVIEGSSLYWSAANVDASGLVARVPLAGGAPVTLATNQLYADCLHSDGVTLAWSNWAAPGVFAIPIDGGPVEELWMPAGSERPHVIEMGPGVVYFSTGPDVLAVPTGGGAATPIAGGFVRVTTARLVGDQLYVADAGPDIDQTVDGYTVTGNPEGTLSRVDLATGGVQLLAQHLDTPVALATTGSAIYWAEAGSMATFSSGNAMENHGTLGRVVRAGLDGSGPVVLADHLVQPGDLAVDASHVYIAEAGTAGGADPLNELYVSDGNLLRVPLGGGAAEKLMPAIDARRVVVADGAAYFSSWVQGVILRIAAP